MHVPKGGWSSSSYPGQGAAVGTEDDLLACRVERVDENFLISGIHVPKHQGLAREGQFRAIRREGKRWRFRRLKSASFFQRQVPDRYGTVIRNRCQQVAVLGRKRHCHDGLIARRAE